MRKTIKFAFELFSLLKIPVFVFSNSLVVKEYNNLNIPLPLVKIIANNRSRICQQRNTIEEKTVIKLVDYVFLTYLGIHLEGFEIVIGPFLETEFDLIKLNLLKKRLQIVSSDSRFLDEFYNCLAVLVGEELEFIVNSVVESYWYKPAKRKFMTIDNDDKSKTVFEKGSLFSKFDYVKNNYKTEAQFLKIVEEGNIEKAKKFAFEQVMLRLPDRALNDNLRNEKTRLTILNTICNRAAIKGGIDYQLGHQVSSNYGVLIERLTSLSSIAKLIEEIIVGYTKVVKDYSLKGYSKLVGNALLIIRRSVVEKCSLTSLANELFVSREHLARTFKKETGQTVSQFISNLKLVEAKKLILDNVQSISNIANMLGFSSSSQFSNIFKREFGLSPKEFRKTISLSNDDSFKQ